MLHILLKVPKQNLTSLLRTSINNCRLNVRSFVQENAAKALRSPTSPKVNKTSILLSVLGGSGLACALLVKNIPTANCEALRRTENYKREVKSEPDPEFCWKSFFELLKPEIWYIIGAVLSALVVALANIHIPLQLGEIVNKIAEFSVKTEHVNDFWSAVQNPAVKLAFLYLIQSTFTFSYIALLSHSGERMAARMRKQLFENIIAQDIEFFDKNKTGAIIHRLTSDVQDFKSSFKSCISQGLRATTQIIGSTAALLYISPFLTTVLLIVVPSMVGVGWFIGSGLRRLSRKCQDQMSLATAVADEAVSNVRTVRAFAMEDKEKELFEGEVSRACKLNQSLGYAIGVFQGLTNIALNGMVLGVLVAGGSLMHDSRINAGNLMSFLVSTQTIQRSLQQLSLLYGYAIRGMAAGARVFDFMKMTPSLSIQDEGKRIPYYALHGDIEFKNVHFTYSTRPDQEVIKGLNLKIPGGQVTALVGLSGGGKSTLTVLLERFYEPTSGQITIDGVDISVCSPKWLRGRCIGFISQEPVLFATSVMENIRYGRLNATDAEVHECAILANAHNFIQSFPHGYDTVLGERGVTVSGGQKQRIAIARALLKNPSILILDEATSALDAESEKLVQEALDRATQGRTVIIIAHRLSTIKNADQIAVLNNGKVEETGNHASLVKKKGLYWRLITHQESGDIL